jgi:hypothetical protein
MSDSATGLNVIGIGSSVLNIASSLGVEDVVLAPGTSNLALPFPLGLSSAQFVFVNSVSVPDLQVTQAGMTQGTSQSAGGPGISVSAGQTLTLNIDGDGAQTILLATNTTGAAIAADIQAKVRALAALNAVNQLAYNGFTATFTVGNLYVLASGLVGTGSSVVVSGGTAQSVLKLGATYSGPEVAGSGGYSEQLPVGAATVKYNRITPVLVSSSAGGVIQFACGG